jgi:hypothetical protein
MNQRLKGKIIEKFGSQIRFAFTTGEDESPVSRIINGWRKPPTDKQARWAEVVGCRVEDIFNTTEQG